MCTGNRPAKKTCEFDDTHRPTLSRDERAAKQKIKDPDTVPQHNRVIIHDRNTSTEELDEQLRDEVRNHSPSGTLRDSPVTKLLLVGLQYVYASTKHKDLSGSIA